MTADLPISHAAKCFDPPKGCGEYARKLPDRTAVIFHAPGCPNKAATDAEEADRPVMVELLTGKYGIAAETAEDILATVRLHGSEIVTVARRDAFNHHMTEGWRFRVALDAGGYTIEELAHEGGPS